MPTRRPTGYGGGSRHCKNGALKIRPCGLLLRVTWSAPAIGTHAAYTKVKTYKT